jgi:hypothetical protein
MTMLLPTLFLSFFFGKPVNFLYSESGGGRSSSAVANTIVGLTLGPCVTFV